MIRFYGYFRSSSSYRCRIAFNLKGIDYDFVPVHLLKDGGEQKKPEYRERNPQMLVPTLEAGDMVVGQSMAILEWLEEKYPEPAFLPDDPDDRARVRAFADIIACDIHPLQNLRVLSYLRENYGEDQEGVERWCQRWIGDGLAACEQLLARREKQTTFCFGETPGLADICLVPQVFSAHRFKVDLAAMPLVRGIHDACEALPAFAEAHPSKQPDAT
ncbi:maleylacetoacetate isomerase [Oricola thermophila]|uniref:Maleylacetoacetate isomerase n=1 Tax=Oricola thermophila TaxID=2742145 RepID=A0A6N1VDY6_9HYPH|nr:maleylacetoacetate isomerase [Oricola thermophila]QKV19191.1 maleylacetoacetate isomerase [Oricola thermophila]